MRLKSLFETIHFKQILKAPSRFHSSIAKLVSRSSKFSLEDDTPIAQNDIVIKFGKNNGLPVEKNTIYVGNKFFDKEQQFSKLKGRVNTIKTYTDVLGLKTQDYIAKKKTGERQQGLMVNELPPNPEDYIFQGLVDILAEFRVVVYYMNGDYHVSGIYKKTGSNVSLSSISTTSNVGKEATKIAIKSAMALGYGTAGCDIAIVSAKNIKELVISENLIGTTASKAMKILGSMISLDDLLDKNYMVLLEANSYPSLSNPAILQDFIQSIEKNSE